MRIVKQSDGFDFCIIFQGLRITLYDGGIGMSGIYVSWCLVLFEMIPIMMPRIRTIPVAINTSG